MEMILPLYVLVLVNFVEITKGKKGLVAVRAAFQLFFRLINFEARVTGTYK